MNPVAVSALACPHCGTAMRVAGRSLVCESRHVFDVARQGYVNLLADDARTDTADTAEMVSARARFFAAGHYGGIADAAVSAIRKHLADSTPGSVVDVGAGTGWFLARILDALPHRAGIALDSSKYAARRAASAHPRAISIVCDAWAGLPISGGTACAVTSFFAPRNPAEFRRVLHPDGVLVVVTPCPDHLHELIAPLSLISVDPDKSERLDTALDGLFEPLDRIEFRAAVGFARTELKDLVAMGPSSHHTEADEVASAVESLPEITSVTTAVDVRTFRPRP